MSRTTNILLLMVMLATTHANMDFSINTTWNGGDLDHTPVMLALAGQHDGSLQIMIEAPFFNDPANPGGKPGEPFFGLWEYEVVEAFFLNDNKEYLEVEVCPWGQHIVLMLDGQRNTIRHSLPMKVTTNIDNTTKTWTGMATIPADYLPKATTKFNAYAIHGSGKDRIYESLYPAPSTAENPDFHALEHFQAIDLSSELPSHSSDPMSKFWEDAINGVFPYSITTNWKGEQMDQEPIKITIQGFEAGVELNVSAPFFNDPKPDAPAGAFMGLWDYEVVEMFFLNDNDEYLEVEVGPWGHHILLMLKGKWNNIKDSLELDYFAERQETTWSGSAMIPPSYFPPNVTRMNAFAIHGVGENRVYQALYPAPANSENPDFHRLELFQPMDFEYQVTDNSEYSDIWEDAIDAAMLKVDEESKEKEKDEEEIDDVVTSLGPFLVNEFTTEIPAEEEEEVTMLSILRNPDEKETAMSSHKVGINQADTKDTVSVRPLPRRPSLTRPSSSRRPNITQAPFSRRPSPSRRRPTVSPVQRKPILSQEENEVNVTEQPEEEEEAIFNVRPLPRRPAPSRTRPTVSPIQRKPTSSPVENEVNVTEQPEEEEEEEAYFNVRPLPRRPAPSRRRTTVSASLRKPVSSLEENEVNVTEQPEEEEEEEANFNVRPLPRRPAPSRRRPTVSASLRKPVSSLEENEVNVTEQPEENEVDVSVRPLSRRPSPPRRRPARPTVSSTLRKATPARRRPRPQPVKIDTQQIDTQQIDTQQIDNSLRPIQNRRLDDDTGNSGNFLPDQKFPSEVLRPTQFLRPIQRPVPQIVERPPQEEITFNQEDEKLQIPSEEELKQKNNEQKNKSENFDGTDKETATIVPGTEDDYDIIQQEENLQSAPLVPLELLHHPVCREAGLIPDQLRCMVFHECVIEDGQWQLYSWRCKRGHHYDPHSVSCVRGRCNLSLG